MMSLQSKLRTQALSVDIKANDVSLSPIVVDRCKVLISLLKRLSALGAEMGHVISTRKAMNKFG